MRSLLRAANDRRFWGAFGAWATILAVLAGASVTIQVAFGLSKFGGLEYVPGVAMVSIVRELGPGSACGALVLSLITWAHYLGVEQLCDRRERILPIAILASAAAIPVTTALAALSSFGIAHGIYGISGVTFQAGAAQVLQWSDVAVAMESFGWNAMLLGAGCWVALPLLARSGWSLIGKVVAAWTCMFLLRALARALFSLLWAG